jgi:hypothetical protein
VVVFSEPYCNDTKNTIVPLQLNMSDKRLAEAHDGDASLRLVQLAAVECGHLALGLVQHTTKSLYSIHCVCGARVLHRASSLDRVR